MTGEAVDDDSGRGCLVIIGIAATSIACGYIWTQAVGWLVLGVSCLSIVALDMVLAELLRRRR